MKNWRLKVLSVVILLLAAIIIGRLFYIQVVNRKFYSAQALGQQSGFSEVQGSRGQMYFGKSKDTMGKSGAGDTKSLAINEDKYIVGAVPKNIKDKDNFAQALASTLGETKEFVVGKLKE